MFRFISFIGKKHWGASHRLEVRNLPPTGKYLYWIGKRKISGYLNIRIFRQMMPKFRENIKFSTLTSVPQRWLSLIFSDAFLRGQMLYVGLTANLSQILIKGIEIGI